MGDLSRKHITIVEIDVPFCSRVYGSGLCSASLDADNPRKCFNTLRTCQDRDNFDPEPLTLRFAQNQTGLPKGQTIFPALASVSTSPAEINLSGIGGDGDRMTALGKRDSVTINLKDFAYQDTLTDKYQAERVSGAAQFDGIGYNPKDKGRFFARLRARWPYFSGASLRVRDGVVGQAFVDMPTRHYFISKWMGPNAQGNVTITAKDVFDLAEREKAQVPPASQGQLDDDLTIDATTFNLSPVGIGSEYPASGRINVGREVMTFTRSSDIVTLTGRGVDGTEASSHSAGDAVQICQRYEDQTAAEIIADLLTQAGVDAAYLPTTDWDSEVARWAGGISFTRTITKPVGVTKLIGELCQHGFFVWWDIYEQKVRLRTTRPLDIGEGFGSITDSANILRGEIDVKAGTDLRISNVIFYHGQIDPTDSDTDGRNYSRAVAAAPRDGSDYDQSAIKTIYSPWFGQAGSDFGASVIARRLLNRYQDPPKVVTGTVDVKDIDTVALGELIKVQSFVILDGAGFEVAEPMQVNSSERTPSQIKFKSETFDFDKRFGFITENTRSDYGSSTDAEIALGTYIITDADSLFADGTTPYLMF